MTATVNEPLSRPLRIVAAAALVNADGRILVQRRPPGRPLADLWEFPGGKLDPGESPEEALIRELDEELGIGIEAAWLAPTVFASLAQSGGHLLLLLYICRKWTGIPEPRHATELAWHRPAALHRLAMPPADRPLIALLEALI